VADLYAAALDMTAWAERVGFDEVRLSAHDGTIDGYLPRRGAERGCSITRLIVRRRRRELI
jgi:hypothetical protein